MAKQRRQSCLSELRQPVRNGRPVSRVRDGTRCRGALRAAAQAASASADSEHDLRRRHRSLFGIESQDDSRFLPGSTKLDRVLGGGIVAGSLVLIGELPDREIDHRYPDGGPPRRNNVKVLYVSGEESERQIKMWGERLGLVADNLFILPETNLQTIVAETEKLRPMSSSLTLFKPSSPTRSSPHREAFRRCAMLPGSS